MNKRNEETNSFYNWSKRMKCLEIYLPKEMQNLCYENNKMLKEMKEDLNKCKDIPCSWIGRRNTVQMAIVLKLIYRFNSIPINIPISFFWRNWQADPKIDMGIQGTQNNRNNLVKNKEHISQFQNYYKAIVIKTQWYRHKNRHIGQWNRTKSPEWTLTSTVNWFSTRLSIQWGKNVFFNK